MTRHLVDPQLLDFVDVFPPFDLDAALPAIREAVSGLSVPLESVARPEISIETRAIAGPAGAPDVNLTIFKPVGKSGPLPLYLNFHGGGLVMGDPGMNHQLNADIAATVGCIVVAVQYRLAPEHPAPAGLEDGYAALAWINKNANSLGADTSLIAVGGDSAGGCIAASLSLLARDRGEYKIMFQLLMGPMLDDRTAANGPSSSNCGEFVWPNNTNKQAWRMYLGKEPGSDGVPAYHSPGRADNLAGMPPAFIAIGGLDVFLDEDIAYARALLAAGVAAELHVIPGAFHGFERHPTAEAAVGVLKELQAALARAFRSAAA